MKLKDNITLDEAYEWAESVCEVKENAIWLVDHLHDRKDTSKYPRSFYEPRQLCVNCRWLFPAGKESYIWDGFTNWHSWDDTCTKKVVKMVPCSIRGTRKDVREVKLDSNENYDCKYFETPSPDPPAPLTRRERRKRRMGG